MSQKHFLLIAVLVVAALTFVSTTQMNFVAAQQPGEAGEAGFGGAGGAGGGGGGGGGFGGGGSNCGVAAYGEYVYVLQQGTLYQYAAYDLTLVKKVNLREGAPKGRANR